VTEVPAEHERKGEQNSLGGWDASVEDFAPNLSRVFKVTSNYLENQAANA